MRKKLKYLSIFLLLFIIFVSSTYAFYVAVVDKNGDGGDVSVTTKRLSMSFTDGPQIEIDGILPGATIIKTFSVNNSSSGEMTYSISFEDVINELSRTDDLVYTLTSTNNGASINETSFPTSDEVIVANQTIAANTTHEYTLTIQYKNLGVDQADDMGKVVSATIVVGQNEDTAALAPGLYNANNELIMSYDDLVSTYNFNPEQDLTNYPYLQTNGHCYVSGSSTIMDDAGIPTCVLAKIPSISTLVLPNTVTAIGNYTFANYWNSYNSLKEIVIPDTVTSIGNNAFYKSNLHNVEINSTSQLMTIGNSAFSNNRKLVISIPNSVESIGEYSLFDVAAVKYNGELTSSDNWGAKAINPYIEEDWTYEDDSKLKVLSYIGDDINISIPDGVETIGEKMLWYDTSISSIDIPSSVVTISDRAFQNSEIENINIANNSNLKTIGNHAIEFTKVASLTLPNGLLSIGERGIAGSSLTNVNIPNTVTNIGKEAFYSTQISSITIPGSVRTMGDGAFWNCTKLENVTLSDGLTIIGKEAFNSTNISSINIPSSVTSIGQSAFVSTKIETINIPSTVTYIGSGALGGIKIAYYNGTATSENNFGAITLNPYIEGDWCYEDNTKTVLTLYIGNNVNVTIPNTVKTMRNYVFYKFNAETIRIPSSVTEIYGGAFLTATGSKYVGQPPSSITFDETNGWKTIKSYYPTVYEDYDVSDPVANARNYTTIGSAQYIVRPN